MNRQETQKEQIAERESRIYLTGFMGSGKTTIGPILANTIGYDFMDMDQAIVKKTGKSVEQIFREDGEEHFRKLEQTFVADLRARHHLVISLGGGTIASPDHLNAIKSSGILIYLKATTEQIYKRLHNKTDRPTLKDRHGERLEEEELRKRIMDLYRLREPFYRQADIVIRTDEQRVGLTVDQIVRKLSPFLKNR